LASSCSFPLVLVRFRYVLAVLEEVAQDVNDKVRQREDGGRILGALTKGGHQDPSAVVSAVLGPAAALVLELKGEIVAESLVESSGNGFSGAVDALTARFASWTRNLSLKPTSTLGRGGKAGGKAGGPTLGRGGKAAKAAATRPGKLFLFRDRVLLAKPTTQGDSFKMLTCWPLADCNARLQRGYVSRTTSTLHEGGPSDPAADDDQASVVVDREEESFELRGETSAVESAVRQIHALQAELVSLRLRHQRRSSRAVAAPPIGADDFHDSMREVAAAL
jgi:hypothetical protein